MRSVLEGRDRALRLHGAGQVSTETDAVARYRRRVKANGIGEGTSGIDRRPIAGIRREDSAREEEEMAKR
jgi:alkylation response protein AidB-like acyl-CoA dehydrogenase